MNNYFLSDLHLGYPDSETSRAREILICNLLTEIMPMTENLWLLGDIFDFWWEYKSVVPAGYVRFFAKLLEFTDNNIPVYIFSGNHDIWLKSYLAKELNVKIFHKPLKIELQNKQVYMAHGDGLGKGDYDYKFLKKIFTNKFLQWGFSKIHPNCAFKIASSWSHSRRKKEKYPSFKSLANETLYQYAKEFNKKEHCDYYVFGHRHIPMKLDIGKGSQIINTGEWLSQQTFACLQDGQMQLLQYKDGKIQEYPYPNPEENPFLSRNLKTDN